MVEAHNPDRRAYFFIELQLPSDSDIIIKHKNYRSFSNFIMITDGDQWWPVNCVGNKFYVCNEDPKLNPPPKEIIKKLVGRIVGRLTGID